MIVKPLLIEGNSYTDDRGTVCFINEFNMTEIKRMYSIMPAMNVIRAWQGHKFERKWFYVIEGAFEVKIIPALANGDSLNKTIFHLSSSKQEVLFIPAGCFNGFKALQANSKLMVFSDKTLEESIKDDIRKTLIEQPWE